jgi:hypothetical protein
VEKGEITEKVLLALDEFDEKWAGLPSTGPAHAVIADNNVEDYHIQWCLNHWDEHEESNPGLRAARREEYEATKEFLRGLLAWPIEERLGPAGLAELEEDEPS